MNEWMNTIIGVGSKCMSVCVCLCIDLWRNIEMTVFIVVIYNNFCKTHIVNIKKKSTLLFVKVFEGRFQTMFFAHRFKIGLVNNSNKKSINYNKKIVKIKINSHKCLIWVRVKPKQKPTHNFRQN